MKNLIIVISFIFSYFINFSQLTINNQKSFGGNVGDYNAKILYNSDSSFIYMIGASASTEGTGNKTAIRFGFDADVWVVKMDLNYNIIWDKNYGGIETETYPVASMIVNDTIYIATSTNASVSGNKTTANIGQGDAWFFSIDLDGNILSQASFGGTDNEFNCGLFALRNGNLLLYTNSWSGASGNKTESLENGVLYHGWFLEVTKTGTIVRQRAIKYHNTNKIVYGHQDFNTGNLIFITELNDSISVNGDKTDPGFGTADGFVIVFDENFNKLNDKCFGGTEVDYFNKLLPLPDGYLFVGASNSPASGNKTSDLQVPSTPSIDLWIMKTDFNLNPIWDHTYGGSNHDCIEYLDVISVFNHFAIVTTSLSGIDGNKTEPNFSTDLSNPKTDLWLILINQDGDLVYQKSLGGSMDEETGWLSLTPSNDIIVSCQSESFPSGNKTTTKYGMSDLWLVELEISDLLATENLKEKELLSVFPNPSTSIFNFQIKGNYEDKSVEIYSLDGKKVFSKNGNGFDTIQIDMSHFENGVYLYELIHSGKSNRGKIVKK